MKLTLDSFVSTNPIDVTNALRVDLSSLISAHHITYKYVGMRRKGHEPKAAWKAVWGNARQHDECVTTHTTSSTMRRLLRGQMMVAMKQARDSVERKALQREWRNTVANLGGFPEYDRYGCAVSDNWDYDPDVVTGFVATWVQHL